MNASAETLRAGSARATLRKMTGAPVALFDERIRDALEVVYRVLAVPVPLVIEGCPCCVATRGVDALLTTPLRALTGEALWRYVSGVFHTVGSERDFRYFLPRILDVAINDPGNSNDIEIALGKLKLANWQSWPADERAAIETLVEAWFERALANDLIEAADGWIGRGGRERALRRGTRGTSSHALPRAIAGAWRGGCSCGPEKAFARSVVSILGGRACRPWRAVGDSELIEPADFDQSRLLFGDCKPEERFRHAREALCDVGLRAKAITRRAWTARSSSVSQGLIR